MILAVYRDNARLSDSLSACNFLGYKGSFKSVLPVLISILPDLTDYTLFLLSAHPPSTTKAHKEVLFISAMRLAVVHLIVSPPSHPPHRDCTPKMSFDLTNVHDLTGRVIKTQHITGGSYGDVWKGTYTLIGGRSVIVRCGVDFQFMTYLTHIAAGSHEDHKVNSVSRQSICRTSKTGKSFYLTWKLVNQFNVSRGSCENQEYGVHVFILTWPNLLVSLMRLRKNINFPVWYLCSMRTEISWIT